MSGEHEVVERRKRQRFLAQRGDAFRVQVSIAGERRPVLDLSLEGFAMPASSPPEANREFAFVLHCEGVKDEIRGRARVVNYLSAATGGQAGCLFDAFDADGAARLEAWLTTHVLENAWVPISEKDATAIVSGPSLI